MMRNTAPTENIDNIPKSLTKNPPIAIPKAIPPFNILKNIPFASSGVLWSMDVSIYCIRLYPIPSNTANININIKTGIRYGENI